MTAVSDLAAITIPDSFGSGGSGLAPGNSAGTPTLVSILQTTQDAVAEVAAGAVASATAATPAKVAAASAVGAVTSAFARPDHAHGDPNREAAGADLTDADATIAVAAGYWRKMPAATLSANRAITLGTTGAAAGDQITITRLDATANTLAVINGGAGAGTLVTLPASKVAFARFQYDGTNWALREVGTLLQPRVLGSGLTRTEPGT